jgi:undecaprenyl-diphosphatase
VIQLGAILAILSVYFARLWKMLTDLPSDARTQRFVLGVLAAFLPAAVIGALAMTSSRRCCSRSPNADLHHADSWRLRPACRRPMSAEAALFIDIMDYPLPSLCFKIGLFQCLAMIPGTSRSGATIVGSLLMGADKRSAAEFSFFLAMPTMAGALPMTSTRTATSPPSSWR